MSRKQVGHSSELTVLSPADGPLFDAVDYYITGLKVASVCPACGENAEVDLGQTPVTYLVIGWVKHIVFQHPHDDSEHVWSVPAVFELSVRAATEKDY